MTAKPNRPEPRRLLAVATLLLTACGGQDADTARLLRSAQNLEPADVELAALYRRSCRACHSVGSTGAPLTGDGAAWEPRLAQGMDLMIEHVINGYKGMPPFGLCMDCGEEEFEALIRFMAEPQAE